MTPERSHVVCHTASFNALRCSYADVLLELFDALGADFTHQRRQLLVDDLENLAFALPDLFEQVVRLAHREVSE